MEAKQITKNEKKTKQYPQIKMINIESKSM